MDHNDAQTDSHDAPQPRLAPLALRSAFGGVLMGLANLVPGISGGTMLLAAGIYPRFIDAISDATRLRFTLRSLLVLGVVIAAAALSIVLLAGALKDLVLDHRWVMYSLFIGLTLGGVPVVWRLARPGTASLWAGALAGLLAMTALAIVQQAGLGAGAAGTGQRSYLLLTLAGVAGASAMILPGVSGGYLLLVLGQYVPILASIDRAKDAAEAADPGALLAEAHVIAPVGIGVILGVVVVSNALRFLLHRFEKPTLGVLLGLLVGAVIGLWPFQVGVEPEPGDVVKGRVMTAELIDALDREDYPVRAFSPTAGQVLASLGLIGAGVALTVGVGYAGRERDRAGPARTHTPAGGGGP